MVKGKFIILRKIKYSESDLIIHAISTMGEKKSFIARGALKSKKRFGGGVLEPSHFVEFNYKQEVDPGKMAVLNDAILINGFPGIRDTYEKLEFALKVLECVGKVSQEGDQSSSYLFNLLGHTLKSLESVKEIDKFQLQFYLKFLLQQGVINPEPWMNSFLKHKISENELVESSTDLGNKLNIIENQVKQYLVRAEF